MTAVITLALISNDVYSDFGSGHVNGYKRLSDFGSSAFFGATYTSGDVGVIAFRGSQELVDWLDADADIALGHFPIDQLGDAFTLFSKAKSELIKLGCTRILVTGHSLGGGLTQIVAARITTTPVVGVTFNAPGMASLTGSVRFPRENQMNVHNYRANNDRVSLYGAHIGRGPNSIAGNAGHRIGALIEALAGSPEGAIRY